MSTPQTSDTPESDAAAREGAYLSLGDYPETGGKQIVHLEVARRLERERNEARRQRDVLVEALPPTDRLRMLAAWIDGMYPNDPEQEVQNDLRAWAKRIEQALASLNLNTETKFRKGDILRKIKGSQWHGRVVGEYSTKLTPEGYAVESSTEIGSVQIYPASALEKVTNTEQKTHEHAFTCKKCGCHAVRYRSDIYFCQDCGERHTKTTSNKPA